MSDLVLNVDATQEILTWIANSNHNTDEPFAAAQKIVRRLGAHWIDGRAEIGFWTPQLIEEEIPAQNVHLEVLTALDEFDPSQVHQKIRFQRQTVRMLREGEYTFGVIEGMTAGSENQFGSLYQLVYQSRDGERKIIRDHLANSIPFGAFAPAELYDMQEMFAGRTDKDHFAYHLHTQPDPDGVERVRFPSNILQIHIRYATQEGTLAALTRLYQNIAEKIKNGETLSPAEQHYIAYDSVQLMPIEPIIEYEAGENFWREMSATDDEITVEVHRPDMTNWGYDVVISASTATNPALLETRRPDELLHFIETLHHFPNKPIKVMLDIVYGHIDNQALPLLNKEYFAGANMYGQNVNFLHPVVRTILIEMMRRKHNYGVDGIRVDGAQDFKWWDSHTDTMVHDDDFLHLMNDIELDVADVHYRPYMIFEDGRPWPRDDWELASTYREVTKLMPNVWQWGPLTFAHNTPFLFTFWMSKWWRIREMADIGREWITGCANHDTLRRGSQVPIDSRINTFLGDTLPEIIRKTYDNPAVKLFDYAMMPGIPMEFINGSMRAPWGFIRNTDDKYGVKVVSEEARWLYWRMDKTRYANPQVFIRLKALGFHDLDGLRRFMDALDHVMQATDYYLDAVAVMMNAMNPELNGPELTVPVLKEIARAFMDDAHDYCNVSHVWNSQDETISTYNREVREFRQVRRWLVNNLGDDEYLTYIHPTDGSTIFYGKRVSPDKHETLLFVANMEGKPRTITPSQLPDVGIDTSDWGVALSTPDLEVNGIDDEITLADSESVVFIKQ